MEAIKLIEQFWEQLKRLSIYAQYCAGSDLHAPVCRDFWLWIVVISFSIGIFILGPIANRVIKEQLEFYRNKKRLEARAIVADYDTMDEHRWKGDDASDVKLSHEDLAAEIRKATRSNTS